MPCPGFTKAALLFLGKAASGEGIHLLQNQNTISHEDAVEQLWRTIPLGTAGSQAQLLGSLVLQKSVCKREGSPLHHPLTISGAYHLGLSSHLFCRPWRPVWSVLVVGWGIPQNSLWVGWLLFSDFKKFLASSSFSLWLSSLHSKAGRILDLTWHWEVLALTFNWRDSPWPRFYACVETLAAKKKFSSVLPFVLLLYRVSKSHLSRCE